MALVKKASHIINFIFRVFKTRETSFLLKLYTTYVLPVIDYGCVVYSPASCKNINRIESIQKHFVKKLPQFYTSSLPYLDKLRVLKVDSLELRRIKFDLCEAFKIIYGYTKLECKEFFLFKQNSRLRNNGLPLQISYCRTNVRKNFFACRVSKVWNSLPFPVISAHSLREFKTHLCDPNVVRILSSFLKCYQTLD